jgi:hypothetical protein
LDSIFRLGASSGYGFIGLCVFGRAVSVDLEGRSVCGTTSFSKLDECLSATKTLVFSMSAADSSSGRRFSS